MAVLRQVAQIEQLLRTAHHVECRPAGQVLDGVVGSVVAAPARHAAHVTLLVEVTAVEVFAGPGLGFHGFLLQERPFGGWHRGGDGKGCHRIDHLSVYCGFVDWVIGMDDGPLEPYQIYLRLRHVVECESWLSTKYSNRARVLSQRCVRG